MDRPRPQDADPGRRSSACRECAAPCARPAHSLPQAHDHPRELHRINQRHPTPSMPPGRPANRDHQNVPGCRRAQARRSPRVPEGSHGHRCLLAPTQRSRPMPHAEQDRVSAPTLIRSGHEPVSALAVLPPPGKHHGIRIRIRTHIWLVHQHDDRGICPRSPEKTRVQRRPQRRTQSPSTTRHSPRPARPQAARVWLWSRS